MVLVRPGGRRRYIDSITRLLWLLFLITALLLSLAAPLVRPMTAQDLDPLFYCRGMPQTLQVNEDARSTV